MSQIEKAFESLSNSKKTPIRKILNQLFKLTPMQSSFNMNMTLVDTVQPRPRAQAGPRRVYQTPKSRDRATNSV